MKLSPYFLYNWVLPADAAPGEDHYYRHNVVRWLVRTGDYTQKEPTKDDVDSFITDFSKCIGTALSLGFKHIFVNPMVSKEMPLGGRGTLLLGNRTGDGNGSVDDEEESGHTNNMTGYELHWLVGYCCLQSCQVQCCLGFSLSDC